MDLWIRTTLIFTLVFSLASCESRDSRTPTPPPSVLFHPETLKIPDRGVQKIRGQVLYMPIYSNIPYGANKNYDLSAFLAVHNTDLKHRIRVMKVTLFNTDGRVVKHYLSEDRILEPFATAIFTIPKKDQSGTGANFLVEWTAAEPVNEPLIESIMIDLSGNSGVSFLSVGKVIRTIP